MSIIVLPVHIQTTLKHSSFYFGNDTNHRCVGLSDRFIAHVIIIVIDRI